MSDESEWTVEIEVASGPHAGLRRTCSGPEVTIGRNPANHVALPEDLTVSSRHARLSLQSGHWLVEECGGRNGLFRVVDDRLVRITTAEPLDGPTDLALGAARLRITPRRAKIASTAPAPRALHITLAEGQLRFRLGGDGPVSRQYSRDYHPELAAEIARDLARLARQGTGVESARRALGNLLARQVIPEALREALMENADAPLLICHDSDVIDVPWELVQPDDEPWCLACALGRQLIVEAPTAHPRRTRGERPVRLLVVADPLGDLPEVRESAESLLHRAEAWRTFLDTRYLGGRRATLATVLRALEEADLVLYSGHGVYDPQRPDASGWRLHDGILGLDAIRRLASLPRLIYSNACNSAEDAPQPRSAPGEIAALGMASGLALAGVELALGARWPVRAASGSVLAEYFFHEFLAGQPAGVALRNARLAARDDGPGDDIDWASLVLYGNPAATV